MPCPTHPGAAQGCPAVAATGVAEAQIAFHHSTVSRFRSKIQTVSTSASGEKREPTFHVSWLLSDGASGEDERINFTCDTEEMLHVVETLREACKASETIAASSA